MLLKRAVSAGKDAVYKRISPCLRKHCATCGVY